MELTLFMILIVVLLFIAYRKLLIQRIKREGVLKENSILPPGYMGLPIIGEMIQFALEAPTGEFFTKREERYGPVFKTHILFKPTIYISSPQTVKQVTLGEHSLVENAWPQSMQTLLGNGSLAASSARDHKLRKQRVVRCFKRERIESYLPIMHDIIVAELVSWTGMEGVKIYSSAQKMTLKAATRIMLGVGQDELGSIETDIIEYAGGFFTVPIRVPGTTYYRATKAKERLMIALDSMLRSRYKTATTQSDTTHLTNGEQLQQNEQQKDDQNPKIRLPQYGGQHRKKLAVIEEQENEAHVPDSSDLYNDVITSLYSHSMLTGENETDGKQQDQEPGNSKQKETEQNKKKQDKGSVCEHAINQSLELLFGGQGTLSGLIVCILIELERNPRVVEKIREELIQHGIPLTPDCAAPSLDALEKLEYVLNVAREALRIYPPVGGGYRRALRSFHTAEGYVVPKGWTLTYSIKGVHDNSTLYRDKHLFLPERWYTISDDVSHFDFMPFGAGARSCVGKEYAKLFIRLFLINLTRAVTWKVVDKTPVVMLKVPVLRPQKDVTIKFQCRNDEHE